MDRQHPLPLAKIEVHDRSHNLNPSVADKNIEPAECFDGLGDTSLDLFFAGYIHRYADSSLAAWVDFLCGCVGSSLIQVGDCNFRPLARKKDRYLLADPARGTSDDGNFVF